MLSLAFQYGLDPNPGEPGGVCNGLVSHEDGVPLDDGLGEFRGEMVAGTEIKLFPVPLLRRFRGSLKRVVWLGVQLMYTLEADDEFMLQYNGEDGQD